MTDDIKDSSKNDNDLNEQRQDQHPRAPATDDDAADNSLDFSGEDTDATTSVASLMAGSPYDPRRAEDGARRTIAYMLIALLWFIIVALFMLIACGTIALADIKEVSVVLGPVVTLVSAATGFYYGTKSTTSPG